MTRAKLFERAAWVLPMALVACTETPYIFFPEPPPVVCATPPCTTQTGGTPSEGGSPAVGSGGTGGIGFGGSEPNPMPGDNCESAREPGVILERLQLAASGDCVAQGMYYPLLGYPAYMTELVECGSDLSQMWAFSALPDGGIQVHSESVDLNLDVRFAATDDNTPAVLYTPHQLYNQRFNVIASVNGDGTFKLAPLHAPAKCLTESEGTLVIVPCATGLNAQSFRRLTCN